jgi:hypothetical protein
MSAVGLGCVETDSKRAAVVDNRCRPQLFSLGIVYVAEAVTSIGDDVDHRSRLRTWCVGAIPKVRVELIPSRPVKQSWMRPSRSEGANSEELMVFADAVRGRQLAPLHPQDRLPG